MGNMGRHPSAADPEVPEFSVYSWLEFEAFIDAKRSGGVGCGPPENSTYGQ